MVVAQDCPSGRIHEMSPFAHGADNCFVVMGVDRNIISGKALNLISGGRAAVDEKWHGNAPKMEPRQRPPHERPHMRGATRCIKDRPRWKIVPGAAPAALIYVNCPGAEMRFFSALGGNYRHAI